MRTAHTLQAFLSFANNSAKVALLFHVWSSASFQFCLLLKPLVVFRAGFFQDAALVWLTFKADTGFSIAIVGGGDRNARVLGFGAHSWDYLFAALAFVAALLASAHKRVA